MIKRFSVLIGVALIILIAVWWIVSSKKAVEGGDLVVVIQAGPVSLDPIQIFELDSAFIGNAAHATLVRIGQTGEVVPVLAESVTVAADCLSASIKLRPGITFWDGSLITSNDVGASLLRLKESANPLRYTMDRISAVESESELECTVRFSAPEPAFVEHVAHLQAAIVKTDSVTKTKEPFDVQVVGAGAWIPMPTEFKSGSRYRFRRNPGFPFVTDPSYLTFTVNSEVQTRLASIQNGSSHLIRLRGPEVREALVAGVDGKLVPEKAFESLKVYSGHSNDGSAILINWDHPNLGKVPESERVRFAKALSSRIPRSRLAAELLAATPLYSVVPSNNPTVNDSSVTVQTEEIPPVGIGLKVELLAANDAASKELASLVQVFLRDTGLDTSVRFVDVGSMVEEVVQRRHQFCITYFEFPTYGPEGWLTFFDDKSPFSAFGEKLPGIAEKVASVRGIIDPEERRSGWNKLISDIERVQSCYIPLLSRQTVVLAAPEVSGVFIDGAGTPIWTNIGLVR